jgi:hypothetical protein
MTITSSVLRRFSKSTRAVQVLLLTGIIASGAFAGPINYVINFTTTSGSPTPTGSFTYDSAAALGSQFTAFVVVWDALTFDFTSQANTPIVNTVGCGAVTSITIFNFLSGTDECPGSPNTFNYDSTEALANSGITFSDNGSPYPHYIDLQSIVGGYSGRNNIDDGTFTVTAQTQTPEPSSFILALTGGAFLVKRCARQPGSQLQRQARCLQRFRRRAVTAVSTHN